MMFRLIGQKRKNIKMSKKVKVYKSKQVIDERGKIILFAKKNSKFLIKYNELYCSEIRMGKVKAWRKHKKNYSLFVLVKGKIKIVYQEKENKFDEIILSEEQSKIVSLPPNIWYGFKGLGDTDSIISNITSKPYSESEIERLDYNQFFLNYDWSIKII